MFDVNLYILKVFGSGVSVTIMGSIPNRKNEFLSSLHSYNKRDYYLFRKRIEI